MGNEVGDLQEYRRVMWSLLTPAQREQFKYDDRVIETLSATDTGEGIRP